MVFFQERPIRDEGIRMEAEPQIDQRPIHLIDLNSYPRIDAREIRRAPHAVRQETKAIAEKNNRVTALRNTFGYHPSENFCRVIVIAQTYRNEQVALHKRHRICPLGNA